MNHFDVIIVGLGPSGSIAALLLETYGIKVLAIEKEKETYNLPRACLLYTSPSPRDRQKSRMPSSA